MSGVQFKRTTPWLTCRCIWQALQTPMVTVGHERLAQQHHLPEGGGRQHPNLPS